MFVLQAAHTKKYFVWGKLGADAWTDSLSEATKEKRRKPFKLIMAHIKVREGISSAVISVPE